MTIPFTQYRQIYWPLNGSPMPFHWCSHLRQPSQFLDASRPSRQRLDCPLAFHYPRQLAPSLVLGCCSLGPHHCLLLMVRCYLRRNWSCCHHLAAEGFVVDNCCKFIHRTLLASRTISIASRPRAPAFLYLLAPSSLEHRPSLGTKRRSPLTAFVFVLLLALSWLEVNWSSAGLTLAFLTTWISNSAWRASWPSFFQELKRTLALRLAVRRPTK